MHALKAIPYLSYISASAQASGDVKAPMMGLILKVQVAPGDRVEKGAVVAILESMKMEIEVRAPVAARVHEVHCAPGKMVQAGQALVTLVPLDAEAPRMEAVS